MFSYVAQASCNLLRCFVIARSTFYLYLVAMVYSF